MGTTSKDVLRRNKRIVKFFEKAGLKVRLIGRPDTPAIIWNESFVLSAYAHNFYLRFTDVPHNGNIVKEYKLRVDTEVVPSEIIEILNSSTHRPVYKVQYGLSDMYLTGYNFLDRDNGEGKYPVFAKHKPKIYFTREKAEEICAMLEKDNYDCCVVEPVVDDTLLSV